MPHDPAARQTHLKRLFTEAFTVMDIAEPLISFDAARDASVVKAKMEARNLRVVGLRRGGVVTGYAAIEDLTSGTCADHIRHFDDGAIVDEDASLPVVFQALTEHRYAFVRVLGVVGGIASRSDAGKSPVRMWLFGMLTLLEMSLGRRIRARFPEGDWSDNISPGRLDKANDLCEERQRRGEHVDLVDCLQLGDKAQVLMRDPQTFAEMRFESRREGEKVVQELGSLRNNLAHSQDIVGANWGTIVELFSALDDLLGNL